MTAPFAARFDRLRAAMEEQGTEALLLSVGPDLPWLCGYEAMPLERWIGFGLVWVALVMLTVDMVLAVRRERRAGAVRADATDAVPSDPLPE